MNNSNNKKVTFHGIIELLLLSGVSMKFIEEGVSGWRGQTPGGNFFWFEPAGEGKVMFNTAFVLEPIELGEAKTIVPIQSHYSLWELGELEDLDMAVRVYMLKVDERVEELKNI